MAVNDRDRILRELPDGLIEQARRIGTQAVVDLRLATGANDNDTEPVGLALYDELFAPLELDPDWPEPSRPHPVGQGWVHWDTIDDDIPLLTAMAERWSTISAAQAASEAQQMRLPVVNYRHLVRSPLAQTPNKIRSSARVDHQRELETHPRSTSPTKPLIVDMSTHWAGPLATKLAADFGVDVIKVDPACRPDGFGERLGLYRHLNGTKEVVDLDLRLAQDRLSFERLLGRAHVLVESFSRRVLPNFGYSNNRLRQSFPNLSIVSIKAFPLGDSRADWLAFGGGVHAASGLGMVEGHPKPAPLPYPDFLTGLQGLRSIARAIETPGLAAEVTLAESILPLINCRLQSADEILNGTQI